MMKGSSEKNALTHEKPPVPLESKSMFLSLEDASMIAGHRLVGRVVDGDLLVALARDREADRVLARG